MEEVKMFNLNLSKDDVNFILNALAKLPFSDVHVLITRILEQTKKQVENESPKTG